MFDKKKLKQKIERKKIHKSWVINEAHLAQILFF